MTGLTVEKAEFYSLWELASKNRVKIFSDSLSESSVFYSYCSSYAEDSVFLSLWAWEEQEFVIEGTCVITTFETKLLHKMIDELDRGSRSSKKYCRCALLPVRKQYGVAEKTKRLSPKAIFPVYIPSGCLPLISQNLNMTRRYFYYPQSCQNMRI